MPVTISWWLSLQNGHTTHTDMRDVTLVALPFLSSRGFYYLLHNGPHTHAYTRTYTTVLATYTTGYSQLLYNADGNIAVTIISLIVSENCSVNCLSCLHCFCVCRLWGPDGCDATMIVRTHHAPCDRHWRASAARVFCLIGIQQKQQLS